jgi:alkylation response protein AidB-like acyl-CoA dehydrogenase
MRTSLTPQEESTRLTFREFVESEIKPFADAFDRAEGIPAALIQKLAERGYLGAPLPKAVGGGGMDAVTLGLLNKEIGRGCSSVRSLLTVHHMVAHGVLRWGTPEQKQFWLPGLANGEIIAAFALSEPNAGSNAAEIETAAVATDDAYLLTGEKKWITFGQMADLFLIFAQEQGKHCAFLVPRETAGLSVQGITGLLGVRASMLATLRLENCRVLKQNLLGKAGFALSHVAASQLDYGRYSVAWGCVGLAEACLEACLKYARQRKQFGSLLKDHQLVRRMISEMMTNLRAAQLLCLRAGHLKDDGDPNAIVETLMAKYFASHTAMKAAADAVQIHGAIGCSEESQVSRLFRDAKIMEIIEGSNEIQQMTIAEYGPLLFDQPFDKT